MSQRFTVRACTQGHSWSGSVTTAHTVCWETQMHDGTLHTTTKRWQSSPPKVWSLNLTSSPLHRDGVTLCCSTSGTPHCVITLNGSSRMWLKHWGQFYHGRGGDLCDVKSQNQIITQARRVTWLHKTPSSQKGQSAVHEEHNTIICLLTWLIDTPTPLIILQVRSHRKTIISMSKMKK